MAAHPDGSQPESIWEAPQESEEYFLDGAFSPDGSQLLFTVGTEIWLVNSDGSLPRRVLETDEFWQVMEWLD